MVVSIRFEARRSLHFSVVGEAAVSFARYAAFALTLMAGTFWHVHAIAAGNGIPVDRAHYANRSVLLDFTAPARPENPRGLESVSASRTALDQGEGPSSAIALLRLGPRQFLTSAPHHKIARCAGSVGGGRPSVRGGVL